MKNEDWATIETIFHAALALPADERTPFLLDKCGDDQTLFTEISTLIESLENESEFLSQPVFELGLEAYAKAKGQKLQGTTIGPFEIGEQLGVGGMGEVFRAVDTRLKRPVALKFLSDSLAVDPTAKKRLVREARASAGLIHPNICPIYGIEEFADHHFLVMQLVEGKTLAESIRDGEFTPAEFGTIARQIISAVAFAHSNGVIHRDLKPGNIMISNDGEVKVLDFGLAKIVPVKGGFNVAAPDDASNLSHAGLIVGTVSYMSPEQLRGEKVDFRTDVFSLGTLLYEFAAKINPFNRKSQAETIAAVLTDNPSAFADAAPQFPAKLGWLIEKCLRKDAAGRFPSAAELLLEFDLIDFGADRNDPRFRTYRFITRAAVLLFGLIVLAFGIYYLGLDDGKRKLAVLPISVHEAADERKYMAAGLTTGISDKLASLSGLEVKNETLVSRFRGKQIEPLQIGRDLRVDAVVTGKILPGPDGPVLETKIIRMLDGLEISSFAIALTDASLNKLPEVVAKRVSDDINLNLTNEDRSTLAKVDTDSPEAKDLYLRGRYYLINRQGEDVDNAILAFRKAKDIDRKYSNAWAGLAAAYLAKSAPGVKNAIKPAESIRLARDAANKAISLDNSRSESFYTLGLISAKYDWNWAEAEGYYRLALKRDPEFLPAYNGLISVLSNQRRFDEAFGLTQKIREIDPLPMLADIQSGLIHYQKGDFAETETILRDLLQKYPGERRVDYLRVYYFLKTKKLKEATEILEPMYRSENAEDKVLAGGPLGYAYALSGRVSDARAIDRELQRLESEDFVPAQERALIYFGLGDSDKVFELLGRSCSERFSSLPNWVTDPIVEDVRSDPRFAEIRRCVNL